MFRDNADQSAPPLRQASIWFWLGPVLYMVLVGFYFVSRYQGLWAENDSAVFTDVIRVFVREGHLIPVQGEVYANGYAYPALSTFIVALTGIGVATLQQLIYPLLACMVILPAWLLYRELSGSARGAALATMLLFMQPEFLFVILRSSHEKFTRTFMLFCLYLLVRSFRLRNQPRLFAIHIGLFYVVAFALTASNNLLANSFFFALAVAFTLGWLLETTSRRWLKRSRPDLQFQTQHVLQRLFYATLTCMGLVYIFTFYLYPPSQDNLSVLKAIANDSVTLVLNADKTQANNAYTLVGSAWVDVHVYLLVSIANWVILLASFVLWAIQGLRWLFKGKGLDTPTSWLMWLLYAAFAAQGALSVVADASGKLGSNLQLRLFPSISVIAVALVGTALAQWRPRRFARAIGSALAIAGACVVILSIFKVTNEPVVSNMWMFYRPYEPIALEWDNAHLKDAEIWTDFNERLMTAMRMGGSDFANGNHFVGFGLLPTTRNILVTTITRLRSSRLQSPLPVPPDALRVYDNGEAQIYHLRPVTPYQR